MKAKELKQKYLDFFVKKGHKKLANVSLVPENDPTALFISAGMHPLVPYLLGEPHPLGKRLTSNQRCLRTVDVENVGDPHHLTFFEMLGNWSLGDYWKKEAITWSWEFLTKELGLPKEKLYVSCFKGDKDAPQDEESAKVWKKLGLPKERIHFFGKKENWWGPVGQTGPCGPDTEMFIDVGGDCRLGKKDCDPSCPCGKYFEVWNDVFMEYNKTKEGEYKPLKQRNVDTGMGVERTTSVIAGMDDVFQTNTFKPIIKEIEKASGKKYEGENKKPMRIIADHLKAATLVIADGIEPSNKGQGYVLRRLIRKSVVQMRQLEIVPLKALPAICRQIVEIYKKTYFSDKNSTEIHSIIGAEVDYFEPILNRERRKLQQSRSISGKFLFDLHQTYGFPFELAQELLNQWGKPISEKVRREFEKEKEKHQKVSRKGMEKKFAGGLADHSEMVTKLHTATHLLHQALQKTLGPHVRQVGSNITPERLRFDFVHPQKMTKEQIKKVERMINQQIKANLPVKMTMMSLAEAKKKGALAFFQQKYGEKVKVYSIGDFSQEVCGGPHVRSTGEIGGVKITKEKAVGAERRRLYAELVTAA